MLFDFGNLITLGIVILLLLLFWLLNKSNRSMDKARKFINQNKEDIARYIEEKYSLIKDYGIHLNVESKSAMELMRRIQTMTRDELAPKMEVLDQLEERMRYYDASLEELVQMTGRVQENLNLVRDESAFVESVGKHLDDTKDKVENIDKEIGEVSTRLETIAARFGEENAGALEKAIAETMDTAKSAIADFEVSARTIERKMEDYQETMDRLERDHKDKLAQNEEQIAQIFTDAVNRAGGRADKAEETALAKLRDQAQDRLNLIKANFEEKIKSVQETVKTKLGEIQEQLKSNREEWKAETAAIETRQQTYNAEWKKDAQELDLIARQQQEQWNQNLQEINISAGQQREKLEQDLREMRTLVQEQRDIWHNDAQSLTDLVRRQAEDMNAAIQRQHDDYDEAIRKQREAWETLSRETGTQVIAAARDTIQAKLGEIEEQFRNSREEWQAETAAAADRQQNYNDAWKQDVLGLNALARQQREKWEQDLRELNDAIQQRKNNWDRDLREFTALTKDQGDSLGAAIQNQNEALTGMIAKQREEWEAASRDIGQDIIAAAHARLDEYRQAQEEQFRQLSGITNDTARLESELRHAMQEAVNRVNGDFTLFGQELRNNWENTSGELNGQLQTLRNELTAVDLELTGIKEKAFENVSKKLQGFEDEFLNDLGKRRVGIDQQLAAWQEAFDKQLVSIAGDSETKRQKAENRIAEDTKKAIAAQGEKLVSDLERLKAETAVFEEGIREEMRGADEARKSFSEQLERDLEEVKNAAEDELNTKIGQYNLSAAETIRQSQRELETHIRNLVTDFKEQIAGQETLSENFRKTMEEWQNQYNARMRELDNSMEEARRNSRELAAENDERVTAARASLDEMRKEITAQAKLFDRTDSLREELNRHVEDMSGNIDQLSQLKNEIAHFENQFIQIKRLEDDVNTKMTRFLSEKRRIEAMENDFNRLLQTSQSVEEKLAQVSNSDDILQTMQVQLRRLEDVIKETEDKYQRIERKSKTLQETNDGIDRNFKVLQISEQGIKRMGDTMTALKTEMEAIQDSVETLSARNEQARDAAEKLSSLDESVNYLERRIADMNTARESLARLATELQKLDKDAQTQLGLIRSLLAQNAGRTAGKDGGKSAGEGAPPPRDRENIIRLKRQGWSIDEIASTMKISKGEVELTLELGPKDM